MNNDIAYLQKSFGELQQSGTTDSLLTNYRTRAFEELNRIGIPTSRHEEWKYTRISSLFRKPYSLATENPGLLTTAELNNCRLPGYETATELVFVNGCFNAALSVIRTDKIIVRSLEEAAAGSHKELIQQYINHSSQYVPDGIHALNTAFLQGGLFVQIPDGEAVPPVYIYNITDARTNPVMALPRSLFYIGTGATVSLVENYTTLGASDSFTSQVMEVVVAQDASLEYYKIQDDVGTANQVSTTHIRQTGRSHVHTVTISLSGGIIRNNLHVVMEADHAESHMYGLYFLRGHTHVDNHTVVDNVVPHCQSNELYKGILDEQSVGVFNGKIFVRKDAQQANAFQSNKNILLSGEAGVNTKPQLEIYADDVKCSHGCTIGSLDEEGLFYLQSRGISRDMAQALLLKGFAADVTTQIKPENIRRYVDELIADQLNSARS